MSITNLITKNTSLFSENLQNIHVEEEMSSPVKIFVKTVNAEIFNDDCIENSSFSADWKAADQDASEAFNYFFDLSQRFASNEPLTQDEVATAYARLYSPSYKKYTQQLLDDPNHPVSAIVDLYKLYDCIEKQGLNNVKKSTSEDSCGGTNGSYFLSVNEKKAWVFKPLDEEKPDLMVGIVAGEGAFREHAAYLLQAEAKEKIYTIPFTCLVKIGEQVGSLQRFIPGCKSLFAVRTLENSDEAIQSLPTIQVQGSLLFDLRFSNWDRHLGNLVVDQTLSVHMIDHGCCLSTSPEDELKIEQRYLPQMLKGWDAKIINHILSWTDRSIEKEARILKERGIGEQAILRMKNAAQLLQKGSKLSKESRDLGGNEITPYDFGCIFLHLNVDVWDSNKCKVIEQYFVDIIQEKNKISELGEVSQRKIAIARNKFVNAKKPENALYVNLLFGSDPNSESSRIDYTVSILGKHIESIKLSRE